MALKSGKLPVGLLEELLRLQGAEDPSVHMGPVVGEDAAVIDLGDEYLVLKTDPVTFAEDQIGWYAVHVNANDVATMGSRPRWFQVTLLLPKGCEEALVRDVFHQIHEACVELGIALTGGHTEVTGAVKQVVVVGDMQGLVAKEKLVVSAGAREGDVLILTKSAGLEGTAILAREKREELSPRLDAAMLRRASEFIRTPGISVVAEALLGAELGSTAMHDPTEGGVAMGLYELSKACGREVVVRPPAIPVEEETRLLCDFYGLNPLGLISSGTLLVAIPRSGSHGLLTAYKNMGVKAVTIGHVGERGVGVRVSGPEGPYPVEPSERDEITKVL
ncbi:MAG: AIR synthase family protein [Thermoplasmata archaeon]